jgi:hypothetical protein
LAATLLQCVTESELTDYPDIAQALAEANIPPTALNLLRRALSPDPAHRPVDGQVFYHELHRIQSARSTHWHNIKELPIELAGAVRRKLEQDGGGQSAEDLIARRLGSATYAVPRLKTTDKGKAELTADEFDLVGDQVRLKLKFTTASSLICIAAEIKDFEQLDSLRRRPSAVVLDSRDFVWTTSAPTNPRRSAEGKAEVRALLEKAVQDAGDQSSDLFKEKRLNSWSALIDANQQLEQRLEEPINYTLLGGSGVEVTLQASTELSGALLDQDRIARSTNDFKTRTVPVTITRTPDMVPVPGR